MKPSAITPGHSRLYKGGVVHAETLPELYSVLVPSYQANRMHCLIAKVRIYDTRYGNQIEKINPKRAKSRYENYVSDEEMNRVSKRLEHHPEASLRFGVSKTGRGYHGDRGDFCLVGGAIEGRKLTLMYRSLELIGGFAYDLCLVNYVGACLDINWKSLTIIAARAHVFALKRNSNEKLYPKLQEIFRG